MEWQVLGVAALIFAARITDVSLGTVRTIMVVNGYRLASWALSFFEVLVWVFAASKVIAHLDTPWYAIAFALGAATGNYIGITVENRLAYGRQVVRVFSRLGEQLAARLRDAGHSVTVIAGSGRDGPIDVLLIGMKRRSVKAVMQTIHMIDPSAFCVIDDVRLLATARDHLHSPTGWRAVFKKK